MMTMTRQQVMHIRKRPSLLVYAEDKILAVEISSLKRGALQYSYSNHLRNGYGFAQSSYKLGCMQINYD